MNREEIARIMRMFAKGCDTPTRKEIEAVRGMRHETDPLPFDFDRLCANNRKKAYEACATIVEMAENITAGIEKKMQALYDSVKDVPSRTDEYTIATAGFSCYRHCLDIIKYQYDSDKP